MNFKNLMEVHLPPSVCIVSARLREGYLRIYWTSTRGQPKPI